MPYGFVRIEVYRFPTPRDPRVGAWGAPNTPKKSVCVSEPQEHFFFKLVGKTPPPPPPQFVLRFKTPGSFSKKISY